MNVSHLDPTRRAFIQGAAATALGANDATTARILGANTSMEVLQICREQGIDIADAICARAKASAERVVPDSVDVEIRAIDRAGAFIGHAEFSHPGAAS